MKNASEPSHVPTESDARRNPAYGELFDQFGIEHKVPRHDTCVTSLEKRGITSHADCSDTIPPDPPHYAPSGQIELWDRLHVYTEGIVAKLDEAGRPDLADKIRDCHSEVGYKRCKGCSTVSKFYNRCE